MPITTLADLFEVGAQNTVVGILERNPDAGLNEIRDALRRRFGPEFEADAPTISNLIGRVSRGMTIADELNRGQTPSSQLPPSPGIHSEYQYTVIVSVPDPDAPDDPGRRIEVPLSIPSSEPLDLESIREYVQNLLTDWQPSRDSIPGGPAADLIRRDVLIRSRVGEFGGDVSDVADIGVVSVYRGG